MFHRNVLLILLILALCLLPACLQQTPVVPISYFPVRQEPGFSLLMLDQGKITLEDGLLRFRSLGSDNSYLLIWPYGHSFRISGSKIEITGANGEVVAKNGNYKQLGGNPVPSIEYYTGEKPPSGVHGPYFLVDDVLKNLYPWDLITWPLFIGAIAFIIGLIAITIRMFVKRRR